MTESRPAMNLAIHEKTEFVADRYRFMSETKSSSLESKLKPGSTSCLSREYGKSPYINGPGPREQLERLIVDDLKDLGLTERESEVYISLSKQKTMKAGDLSRQVRLHKAQVYRILKNLEEKGLVDSTLEVPARFNAVRLDKYLALSIKARIEDAKYLGKYKDEMLSRWRLIDSAISQIPTERFQIIAGRSNIYAKILDMIDDADEEVYVLTTSEVAQQISETDVTDAVFQKAKRNKDIMFRYLISVKNDNDDKTGNIEESRFSQLPNVEKYSIDGGAGFVSRFVIKDEEAIVFLDPKNTPVADKKEQTALWTNNISVKRILRMFFEELGHDAIAEDERLHQLGQEQLIHHKMMVNTPRMKYGRLNEAISERYGELFTNANQLVLREKLSVK